VRQLSRACYLTRRPGPGKYAAYAAGGRLASSRGFVAPCALSALYPNSLLLYMKPVWWSAHPTGTPWARSAFQEWAVMRYKVRYEVGNARFISISQGLALGGTWERGE
jgi:hypothetical protein